MDGNLGLLRNYTELNNQLHPRISRTKYKETKYIYHKYKTQSWTCTWSVRKVSDRISLCKHLMDYNLARLHEPTLNLSAHA